METEAIYKVTNECSPRDGTLRPVHAWISPDGHEIKGALQQAGWSGVHFARVLGVDPRTARRWTGNEKTIPYAAWAILCVEAGYGRIWNSGTDAAPGSHAARAAYTAEDQTPVGVNNKR